jgi:thiamine-monophosphate kinase
MKSKQTPISAIGEFGLIERLKKKCDSVTVSEKLSKQIVIGISDDTAVIRPSEGMLQLSTSDLMIEGIHFDLTYTSMRHLGWKLMVANLSDIAAMGGVPVHAIITVAFPAKISVEMVDDFYDGIVQAAQTYTCAIVGGDTNTTLGNSMVSATITGEVAERNLKRRSNALPGDLICVSGRLGLSHAGLKILLHEKQRFLEEPDTGSFTPQLEDYTTAVSKHLAPKARFDISTVVAQKEWVHAMIDISDGLASDLRHICNQSGTGARLWENQLKVDPIAAKIAGLFNESVIEYILFGGEEYELLFTIHPDRRDELIRLVPDCTVIGEVTDDAGKIEFVRTDGSTQTLGDGGYDHFRK